MDRKFDIGDRVICKESGVIGKVLKFYNPTATFVFQDLAMPTFV